MKKTSPQIICLGLCGASGRMGKEIQALIEKGEEHGEERGEEHGIEQGAGAGEIIYIGALKDKKGKDKIFQHQIDVWIDFSSPKGFFELCQETQQEKTPIVTGVTGFTAAEKKKLISVAKNRSIFWSSNFSPGLFALRQALRKLTQSLPAGQFSFAVDEIHHLQKKDSPSGTARTLHGDLEKLTGKKIPQPNSHRVGGVFGVHHVIAGSRDEVITLTHESLSRQVFAAGALAAAKWLLKQNKNGLYLMEDMYL